ncbi:MAG: trypsin-like peptidase domain-containing protein [Gammaproteobacteria bacterium]|nr:trypsin-like peptidase domain-containing protein [Gammaproteobacteria bacterium]MBU1439852.1 trypsin-like peptidase domain-containing protein [Gammaproteobacteria bacterium]MBU2286710.1 trypsin-like peptidase domain-containing protein [Gammaproteobacteria bacterium]
MVDISTLSSGRTDNQGDGEFEFAPEGDFTDRLASPLHTSVALSLIRDLASGVILTSDGLILTSAHLVNDVDEARVKLADGRRFSAKLVGIDVRSDVALLKIDAQGLPTASIGDSSRMQPGDWVAAIGSPFGFRGSITTGVISATGRMLAGGGEVPFLQTDVAINPGSSGGPLFNRRGEVVGLNSLIYSANGGYMGLSFAVPSNVAMQIVSKLRSDGQVHRAYLGAELQELTPELAQSFALPASQGGGLVVKVTEGSPARVAGLAAGDVVLAVDGKALDYYASLVEILSQKQPGASLRLTVWRHGARRDMTARLVERASSKPTARTGPSAHEIDTPEGALPDLGLRLVELPKALRQSMGIDAGLLVRWAEGAARSEGIRPGDVILALNDVRMDRVDDFSVALAAAGHDRPVALLVLRELRLAYVAVKIP